jgi:hypothetical protein
VDVNPLLINYHRANTFRQYEGLPPLVLEGNMPIFELGAEAVEANETYDLVRLAVRCLRRCCPRRLILGDVIPPVSHGHD